MISRAVHNRKLNFRPWLVALLMFHVGIVAWEAAKHGPNLDELAHLSAGILIWEHERFDLYPVNPPLAKIIASLPAVFLNCETNWSQFRIGPGVRSESQVGADLLKANGESTFMFLTLGRWALIPFSILGALTCYRWATQLYDARAGFVACFLWCTSPSIIAWASTMNADVPAAAVGVMLGYAVWRWSHFPSYPKAIGVGLLLGLAALCKFTLIIFVPFVPLIAAMSIWRDRTRKLVRPRILQATVILVIALYSINLGYLFKGTFRTLGSYNFVSGTLAGDAVFNAEDGYHGNRFRNWRLAELPVPLPADYLLGIDLQKHDFDIGRMSYLAGRWKHGGWWYFYIAAFLLKEPLGIILAAIFRCSLLGGIWDRKRIVDGLCLGLPALVIFVVVSTETGFTSHLRYVLPAYPFLFVWISRLWKHHDREKIWRVLLVNSLLVWIAVSSVAAVPHSHSYFNELAGGTRGGPNWLLDSNIDYGEDSLDIRRWYDSYPDARPLYVAVRCPVPKSMICANAIEDWDVQNLQTGWYILSVHVIHRSKSLRIFTSLKPYEIITPSIYVYYLSPNDLLQTP